LHPSTAIESGARADATPDRTFLVASACLFVASAVATVAWCGAMSGGMAMPGGWTMSMAWMRMEGQTRLGAAATFMGMWVVMMVAMMVPSLVPMLSRYRREVRGDPELGRLAAIAGAGYFFAWTVFGAAAYPIGLLAAAAAMRWDPVARTVPVATGVVLVLAGCLQATAWKARQLARCRDGACEPSRPVGSRGAWSHGIGLGLHCIRCCLGLMATLLVTGVMDVGAMTAVAAAITAERLAPRPGRVARTIGCLLVAAGAVAIATALGAGAARSSGPSVPAVARAKHVP
jgi:predicted metal-binding membrane protein